MERDKHLNKAEHNEKFFSSFDVNSTDFKDWIVTGIFYAAIHYYEAYFALENKHSNSHHTCDDWISNDEKISDTHSDYRELKQHRRQASYKEKIFTSNEIRDIILPKFNNIKSKILSIR